LIQSPIFLRVGDENCQCACTHKKNVYGRKEKPKSETIWDHLEDFEGVD